MSDSSEDEDLSRFREVVDTSFLNLIQVAKDQNTKEITDAEKPKSQRYLEESSHYNDVKVPEEMQKRIWAKVSNIIQKKIVFVDGDYAIRKQKIKGGVKLFKSSEGFLSPEEAKDIYTQHHNIKSKKFNKMKKRRQVDELDPDVDENDKITATAISGEYILSKEDTKCWKSRRKEKLYKYKGKKKSKVLTLVD